MRSRIIPVVGLSVAALALASAFAPLASAHNGVGAAHKAPVGSLTKINPNPSACYAQRDNDNGIGIVSQNFETSLDAYDNQGADDFALTATCNLTTVAVDGIYFNGSGPANSVNVTIYKWKKSKVKAAKVKCPNSTYTDSTGTGSFIVNCKGTLKKGKYWVSVQANMDFSVGGEWGWLTNNTVRMDGAVWQNPGGGFGTPCAKYTTLTTCIAAGEGGDFSFEIN